MKIGILGAGAVGSALGVGWAKKGHDVVFGVRNPDDPKYKDLIEKAGKTACPGSIVDAAKWAEVVVLAVPAAAAYETLLSIGDLVAGKTLLDCTNPLKPDMSGVSVPEGSSGGQHVATWAPGAHVVKIFNSCGAETMSNPVLGGQAVSMLYAGDDPKAKATAAGLASDLGFDPIDAGPLARARQLEELCVLWIGLAYGQQMGRGIGFKLLRR
jgi:predicted dinucleotide-binding enzyme